jgi:tetratricopeptide (TPR) repeat protein
MMPPMLSSGSAKTAWRKGNCPPGAHAVKLLLCSLLAGCIPALICPARGGPQWHELVSPHYVLTTDLSPQEARTELLHFEESYDVLARFAFAASTGPVAERTQVVLFRSPAEYHDVGPQQTAGRFIHHPFDPEDTPVIAMFGDYVNQPRRVLQHELSHFFIARYLPSAPVWLNEGLATYYETTVYDNGKVVFGQAREDHLRTLAQLGLPPLRRLLLGGADKFYDDASFHYAGAWLLVHMLNQGPGHQRTRFYSYLNALASGQSPEAAWRGSYGELNLEHLDQECRRYMISTWDALVADFRPAPAVISPARQLTDSQVHLTWERLRDNSAAGRATARLDLQEALAREPGSAEANYRLALRLAGEQPQDAERLLRAALAVHPQEPRYWHAMFRVRLHAQALSPDSEDGAAGVQQAFAQLVSLGRSARALDTIARYHTEREQLDEALDFAQRSVDRDPGCWACRDTLAQILSKMDSPAEALAEQRRAINLLPEGLSLPSLHRRLKQYLQATWTKCRRTPLGAVPPEACRALTGPAETPP